MTSKALGGLFTISDSDDEGELDDVEIGVEELVPESDQEPKSSRSKKKSLLVIGLSMVGVVACGTGLTVGLHRGHGDEPDLLTRKRRADLAQTTALVESAENESAEGKEQRYMSPPDDPIPVSLRIINPSILQGYPEGEKGCAALREDIYNATAIRANEVIKRNAQYYDYRPRYYGGGPREGARGSSPPPAARDDVASKSPPADEAAGSTGEDSYGTNNQEAGVDEADIMKSDGKHVFAGYGDILVVWDAESGAEVSRTQMPPRKMLTREEGGYEYMYDRERKAKISGLLLEPDRLVVIASGYSSRYRYDFPDQPVLSNKDDTLVLLYDLSSLSNDGSELPLISSEKMSGQYCSARKVDSVAHIARSSSVEHYRHIDYHLSKYRNEFWQDTKEEYIAHATSKAKQLLDVFSRRLTDELMDISGGSDCSAVTRVALWASGADDEDGMPESFVSGGIVKSYLQISSFGIASPTKEEGLSEPAPLAAKTVGSFFPSSSYNLEMYASQDVMVIAGRGYHRDAFTRSWGQSTYFLSFKLHDDGSAPSGLSIGQTPGYLLNQFSMDEYDGTFRVATTERARWGCVPVDPSTIPRHSHPHYRPYCRWERINESKSRLTVFKYPEKFGEMEPIAILDNLGQTEEIKSVRFFDDKAYIVTFMKTDPLYTIDFSDPEDPRGAGELKISGFSSYLHPASEDRLLAIGKEANETTGRVTGFQITLFDTSDLNNTKVLQRHTINQRWASSGAERDHLAFRYLPLSKLLILPISIRSSRRSREAEQLDPFDGFKVFYVSDEEISDRLSISMASPHSMKHGCWYSAYLPARSMVFSGDLTVAKGHGYTSYNLQTNRMRWARNLDANVPQDKCHRYWG